MSICWIFVLLCVYFTVCSLAFGIYEEGIEYSEVNRRIKKRQALGWFKINCPYKVRFERPIFALDRNNTNVRLLQRPDYIQKIFTVGCDIADNGLDYACDTCCGAVDSGRYSSKCTVTRSLRKATICATPNCTKTRVDWIYYDSGCTCKVEAKT